jgi:glycosyltransferase involved in cell wall biosynthesis
VVVPSVIDTAGDRDGFPNVVLEAMACGRAVVASDVSAIARAVRPGSTGMLVTPGDPAALADALRTLAEDRDACARLGRGAREMVRNDFDLARCAARFVQALEAAYG